MAAGGILPSCTRNRGIRVRISARALRKLSYCNRYHNTYWASGICRREQNMLCISSMCGIIKLVSVRAILSRYENCVAVIASGAVNFRENAAQTVESVYPWEPLPVAAGKVYCSADIPVSEEAELQ